MATEEQVKNVFGDNADIIKAFSKINAIQFQYNDKAHELDPAGVAGVDDDMHVGVKAQELLKNPITSSAVEVGPEGYLGVDTKEMTMTNTAVLSEVCKRIDDLEKTVKSIIEVLNNYGR